VLAALRSNKGAVCPFDGGNNREQQGYPRAAFLPERIGLSIRAAVRRPYLRRFLTFAAHASTN
jgi:hypothetical protein